MNRILTVVIVLMTSVLLIVGCSTSTPTPTPTLTPTPTPTVTPTPSPTPTPAPAPQVGKPAPDFQLPNLEGQSISLSDFRGKPVMLNFWATWCAYCRYEMPYIQEIYEGWTGKPPSVVVLAINTGESSSKARGFLESHGFSFPVLLDTTEAIAQSYSVRGIPTTFFIDEDGIIQEKIIGAFPNKESIEQYLIKIIP